MTTDPNWLEIVSESYTQEVSESARNLHEEADQMFNLIETIETALDVDLTEEQVDALISGLSEGSKSIQRQRRRAKSSKDIFYAQEDLKDAEEKRLAREMAFSLKAAKNMRLTGDNTTEYDNPTELAGRNAIERAQNQFDVASDMDNGRGTPSVEAIEAAGRKPGQRPRKNKERRIKLNRARPNQTPRGTVPKAPTTAVKADRLADMDQQNFSR